MKKEDLDKQLNSIKEKIGEDEHGKIVGEISIIMNENEKSNQEIISLNQQLANEKQKNQQYLEANAVLLQQVGNGISSNSSNSPGNNQNTNNEEQKIKWEDCFDKKGNFKIGG